MSAFVFDHDDRAALEAPDGADDARRQQAAVAADERADGAGVYRQRFGFAHAA